MSKTSFASDNFAGVHPEVMKALTAANTGHVTAYGDDELTQEVVHQFGEYFGSNAKAFFVFNGTAANVLSLQAMTKGYEAVVCAASAHVNVDECGAPEKLVGCKLLCVDTQDGKLTVDGVRQHVIRRGDQHYAQPKVVSISQTTELGTLYQLEEIKALADYSHENNMYLHMDGARLSNAAASLGCTFAEMTTDVGVDVVSFGGTKNGLMIGEAVVLLNPALHQDFLYIRKQYMQLASKMRFLAAQFRALFTDNLWYRNASHANSMAKRMETGLRELGDNHINVTQAVEGNALFVQLPAAYIKKLHQKFAFYVWDEEKLVVRLMMSFDTQAHDVDAFIAEIKACAMTNSDC